MAPLASRKAASGPTTRRVTVQATTAATPVATRAAQASDWVRALR
jgi:hypothetical protein